MQKHQKSIMFMALLIVIAIVLIVPIIKNVALWNGWTAVSAIATLLASASIIVVCSQYFMQMKDHSMGQVRFLMELSNKFMEASDNYNKSWEILRKYPEPPKAMNKEDFYEVTNALEKCYESTMFLYQIAQLDKYNIIDRKLLYLLHYNKIVEHPESKINYLIRWCGTGLELAANYDANEVARMIPPIKELIIKIGELHSENRGTVYEYQILELKRYEDEFIPNINKFDMFSDNYVNNYVKQM